MRLSESKKSFPLMVNSPYFFRRTADLRDFTDCGGLQIAVRGVNMDVRARSRLYQRPGITYRLERPSARVIEPSTRRRRRCRRHRRHRRRPPPRPLTPPRRVSPPRRPRRRSAAATARDAHSLHVLHCDRLFRVLCFVFRVVFRVLARRRRRAACCVCPRCPPPHDDDAAGSRPLPPPVPRVAVPALPGAQCAGDM